MNLIGINGPGVRSAMGLIDFQVATDHPVHKVIPFSYAPDDPESMTHQIKLFLGTHALEHDKNYPVDGEKENIVLTKIVFVRDATAEDVKDNEFLDPAGLRIINVTMESGAEIPGYLYNPAESRAMDIHVNEFLRDYKNTTGNDFVFELLVEPEPAEAANPVV